MSDAPPRPEDLLYDRMQELPWDQLDTLAGELTELQLERAEAYWRERANDIFVRNRPEIVQQLAQLDALNLQTAVLTRRLAEIRDAVLELKAD